MRLEGRVYRATVRSVLLYGCETLSLRCEDAKRLQVFDYRCLRAIAGVEWFDRRINDSICSQFEIGNRLNDILNFFLATVTSICDLGLSDSKVAVVLDAFQSLLTIGLGPASCPAFFSTTCLTVVRFCLKLSINQELVLAWIRNIVVNCPSESRFEAARMAAQLMRLQSIDRLPDLLASDFDRLTASLSPVERKLVVEENELNQTVSPVDEAQAMDVTLSMDVDSKLDLIDAAAQASTPRRSRKKKKLSLDDLFASHPELLSQARTVLYSVATVADCNVTLPSHRHEEDNGEQALDDTIDSKWLASLLAPLLNLEGMPTGKCDILRSRRSLDLFNCAVCCLVNGVAVNNSDLSPGNKSKRMTRSRRSSSSITFSPELTLLAKGIDYACPLLLALLSDTSPVVRLKAYACIEALVSVFSTHLITSPCPLSSLMPKLVLLTHLYPIDQWTVSKDEVVHFLQADPLCQLTKTRPLLASVALQLLLSEPLSLDDANTAGDYSQLCWRNGLRLLTEDTVASIISMSASNSGWSGLLRLAEHPTHPLYSSSLLPRLTPCLFDRLRAVTNLTSSLSHQLLAKLIDHSTSIISTGAGTTVSSLHSILSQLGLTSDEFDFLLHHIDRSRHSHSRPVQRKSLTSRINASRQLRRQSRSDSLSESTCDSTEGHQPLDHLSYLHRLRIVVSLLNDAWSRICVAANVQSLNASLLVSKKPFSPSLSSSGTQLVPLLQELFVPLIHHLVGCLTIQQHLGHQQTDNHQSKAINTNPVDLDDSFDMSSEGEQDDDSEESSSSSTNLGIQLRQCMFKLVTCASNFLLQLKAVRGAGGHHHRRRQSEADLAVAQSAVDPLFLVLTIYPSWPALAQQVLLCLIELASLFPLSLCQRLIQLIKCVAASSHAGRCLTSSNSLGLLGRLVAFSVPPLIEASPTPCLAALQAVGLFVDDLPSLAQGNKGAEGQQRKRLALFLGLLRAISGVTNPLTDPIPLVKTPKRNANVKQDANDKVEHRRLLKVAQVKRKSAWLINWLWTSTLMCLSRNWPDQTTAEDIGSFLTDLFGQFPWEGQIQAWYECLSFLLTSLKGCQRKPALDNTVDTTPSGNRKRKTPSKIEVVDTQLLPTTPVKRQRMASNQSADCPLIVSPCSSSNEPTANFDTLLESLPLGLCHLSQCLLVDSSTKDALLALSNRAVDFLASQLANDDYVESVKAASKDPLGLTAVYGSLVERVVLTMLHVGSTYCSKTTKKVKVIEEDSNAVTGQECAKQLLNNLHLVLLKIHDSVSGGIFIRMVTDLFASSQRNLRRKALELLLTKLTNLTTNLEASPPIFTIDSLEHSEAGKKVKRRGGAPTALSDIHLEPGLVQLTAQLSLQFQSASASLSSAFARQCLACLRCLAQLLAHRYPGEFTRTLDLLLARPVAWWKPTSVKSSGTDDNQSHSSSLAESRSLGCLLFSECLHRLSPSQSLCPTASSTTQRLTALLHLGLDHCSTAIGLTDDDGRPMTLTPLDSTDNLLVSHSRDEHLLAALTLLDSLVQLTIIHRRQSPCSWLTFDSSSSSDQTTGTLLLRLLCYLKRLPSLAATLNVKPDRSSATLAQIKAKVEHVSRLIYHVVDLKTLLTSVTALLQKAISRSDSVLFAGLIDFIALLSSQLTTAEPSQPLIEPKTLWRLVKTALSGLTGETETAAHQVSVAMAWLLTAACPPDDRVAVCRKLIAWPPLTEEDQSTAIITRLGYVFDTLNELAIRITPDDFSELSKQLSLLDLIVVCCFVASGRKSKVARKLAPTFGLKPLLTIFKDQEQPQTACLVKPLLACLTQWLAIESQLNGFIDSASWSSSLPELIPALLSLLSTGSFTELDLQPVLVAYVNAQGDEGLSPLLNQLASLLTGTSTNWRTRLSSLRLADTLVDATAESFGGDNSLLLRALSEALEDDQPEVEQAANQLFAKLDRLERSTKAAVEQMQDDDDDSDG